jgi:23S rRNA pseudouridine955/2504/2580 synthase
MSGVQTLEVTESEADQRLDRWFRRRFPALGHGRLEKLLRTGQIRVDGGRAKASTRLAAGQSVRVPPLDPPSEAPRPAKAAAAPRISEGDLKDLRAAVLHQDDWLIALNKPPGLATQGGSGLTRHLDAMLDGLKRRSDDERPRLVHRLDKDTSGVLLLARTARAAKALAEAFRRRETRKVYWALAVGTPKPRAGTIRAALSKEGGAKGERMVWDDGEGKPAITDYQVIDDAAGTVSWLWMEPRTGRTHQLRAHALVLGTPILGDGKYGGQAAFVGGAEVARRMHLHARLLSMPHPAGGTLTVEAPLPPHMADAFRYFGFQPGAAPRLEDMA